VWRVFCCRLLWCFTVRTGSLWFAVGMHAAFDFGETFYIPLRQVAWFCRVIFPTPRCGPGAYRRQCWPEASLFDFVLLFIFFYVIHRLYPPSKARAG
jgi:membrane protease YdiL (CAAX protease family)